jgi:hypothetical protein
MMFVGCVMDGGERVKNRYEEVFKQVFEDPSSAFDDTDLLFCAFGACAHDPLSLCCVSKFWLLSLPVSKYSFYFYWVFVVVFVFRQLDELRRGGQRILPVLVQLHYQLQFRCWG